MLDEVYVSPIHSQKVLGVTLIHRGEAPPLRIAAQELDNAGFEVDAEPLPLQQEEAGTGRWRAAAQAGEQATWNKRTRQ